MTVVLALGEAVPCQGCVYCVTCSTRRFQLSCLVHLPLLLHCSGHHRIWLRLRHLQRPQHCSMQVRRCTIPQGSGRLHAQHTWRHTRTLQPPTQQSMVLVVLERQQRRHRGHRDRLWGSAMVCCQVVQDPLPGAAGPVPLVQGSRVLRACVGSTGYRMTPSPDCTA